MNERLGARFQLVVLGLVFLVSFFFHSETVSPIDHQDFMTWVRGLNQVGIANAYQDLNFNYGPVSAYVFYGFGWLLGTRLEQYHLLMRQWFFLFDLGSIFVLMRFLEWNYRNAFRALLVLFNVAFFYNSLMWGQSDGIHSAFVLACLVAGLMGQPEVAGALYVLAFNAKPQPIIYLPLLILILLPWLVDWKRAARILLVMVATQLALVLPFLLNGGWLRWLASYFANLDLFPVVSMKAFNIWYLMLDGDLVQVSDATLFLNLSLKFWGVVMFAVLSLLVLVPIGARVGARLVEHAPYQRKESELVLLAAGMIGVGFFFFNTEMHERYAFTAVLLLGAYAVLARDYVVYALVSVAHVLNVSAVFDLFSPSLPLLSRLEQPKLVAGIFLVSLVLGIVQLYRRSTPWTDWNGIKGAFVGWRQRRISPEFAP